MGVAGAGKTTVGRRLAERLGWEFGDGDDFHPAANVAKMRSGQPLNDEDRRPWLLSIQSHLRATQARGESCVIACSALKDAHRQLLLQGEPWVRFIHLHGSRELLAERISARKGHFMPASLLDTQMATLEPPDDALRVDVAPGPDEIVSEILRRLNLSAASGATDTAAP